MRRGTIVPLALLLCMQAKFSMADPVIEMPSEVSLFLRNVTIVPRGNGSQHVCTAIPVTRHAFISK